MPPTKNPRSPRAPRPAPAFTLPAAAALEVEVAEAEVLEAAVLEAEVLEAAVDADEDELPEAWFEITPPSISD